MRGAFVCALFMCILKRPLPESYWSVPCVHVTDGVVNDVNVFMEAFSAF